MFTKRKGIVIGETYLFDVLNETNMANSTSLVTVVKKEKADTYVVVSVNCGDVFRTKAKYLTPYVDPKTASVVRCQYGTTEFNDADIKFFDIVEGTIDMLTDCFKELNIEEDIIEQASSLKIINKKMKKKIQKYVDISNYKDNINVMLNVYSKIKDKLGSNNFNDNIPHAILEEDNKAVDESEFKEKFDNVVDNYIYGNMDIDEFIDDAKETIMNYYPKELLYNKMEFDTNIANDVINGVVHRMLETDGCIMFAVSMDNDDEWRIKDFVYEGEDANTSTQNIFVLANDFKGYIDSLYPELESDGKCFPKYRFNIITISKRKEKESDDNE